MSDEIETLTTQLRTAVDAANANAAEGLRYKAERDAAQAEVASLWDNLYARENELDAAQAEILAAKAEAWNEGWNIGWDGRALYDCGVDTDAATMPNPYYATPSSRSPKNLFYENLRAMNPSKELSAAIDSAEARESAANN